VSKTNPYGEILKEIEAGLCDHDDRVEDGDAKPYQYTDQEFRACLKIFMAATMWKLWEKMEAKSIECKAGRAEQLGAELREFILDYTGIDTAKLR